MRFARLFSCAIAAAIAITAAATAASAQEKKVIRVNHAGADDIVGTDTRCSRRSSPITSQQGRRPSM